MQKNNNNFETNISLIHVIKILLCMHAIQYCTRILCTYIFYHNHDNQDNLDYMCVRISLTNLWVLFVHVFSEGSHEYHGRLSNSVCLVRVWSCVQTLLKVSH